MPRGVYKRKNGAKASTKPARGTKKADRQIVVDMLLMAQQMIHRAALELGKDGGA